MADKKITQLTDLPAPSADDVLPIVDDPAGTPVTKKVTVANLAGALTHNILSVTHPDTLPAAVVRGDLIIGNSTPAWARLVVGAANSVLWTDGTDVSWSAAPRLANIADTGGTNRITTATSSPHVTVTGTESISGNLFVQTGLGSSIGAGVGAATVQLQITTPSGEQSQSVGCSGITVSSQFSPSVNSLIFTAITGIFGISPAANVTGTNVYGLSFVASAIGATGVTFADVVACRVRPNSNVGAVATAITRLAWYVAQTGVYKLGTTATTVVGLDIENLIPNANLTATNSYGIRIAGIGQGTNRYGIQISDITAGTIASILELGPTPYLRLQGSGNWTAAANRTPLFVAEGATPTLRQLRTFDPGNLGVNFTAGQLVAVLV